VYHWFRFSVAGGRDGQSARPEIPILLFLTERHSAGHKKAWTGLQESPPVMVLVPLKVVGAPIQEYDGAYPFGAGKLVMFRATRDSER